METIRIVCAHDCPDMCSLLAEVEDGRVKRVRGDPDQPFTAGFACAKVNRDHELVHSPERLATPLRRVGAKGEGKFTPISWDEALGEITGKWQAIIAESGPEALLGYAYSAHQGQLNRGLMLGLFHALGASRLIAGSVCDTCCEEAWNVTVGPVGGADPEAVDDSDLIISWGADLVATNVHFWARVEAAQKRGVKLVVFVAANNPAVTCPEAGKVRQGLMRDDLFTVVHDPFMTATARYADLVLPATTYLETEDFYRAYGAYYLQSAPAAVAPQGEAWSNLRLAQELARRMGLQDAVFSQAPAELVEMLIRGAKTAAGSLDILAARSGKPINIAPPGGQEFRTPSGKLEFYSEQLAAAGDAPMPDWQVDPQEACDAARWPLRLLTAPGYFQAHTAYAGVGFLRRREGQPVCILHPEDAARRGLADGVRVRLFNERGEVGLMLKISDEIQPGVALVPGQRPDDVTVAGTINILVSDRYTDLGDGATYQSTFLDVEAWRDHA